MQTLLLSLALCLTGQTAADFKSFKPDDGLWEAKLPGTPRVIKQTVKTAVGDVEVTMYMVERGNDAYGVAFNDYPGPPAGDTKKVLEGGMKGNIDAIKGKLLSSKPIKLGDIPGLEFDCEITPPGADLMIGRYRYYLVGSRLYQVIIVAAPETARSDALTKMLDSFKVNAKSVKVPSMTLKPYKSENGKWEVSLPGTPKVSVNKTQTAVGPLDLNICMVEKGNEEAYAVMFSEVPGAKRVEPNTFLDASMKGAVDAVKGKLVKSENIKLDGSPGRAFEYEVPNADGPAMLGRQRIFLVNETLYQVIIIASPETARSGFSTRIFDSFKLTSGKVPAGKAKAKSRR